MRFAERPGLKIPHMGWNAIRVRGESKALANADGKEVYFVHSYYPLPADEAIVAATAEYPEAFCCAVRRGNLVATQFHPEKSQRVGLGMLRRFAE